MSFKLGLALGLAAGVVVGLVATSKGKLPRGGPFESSTESDEALEGLFRGNGQASPTSEPPTVYRAASEGGEPPTLSPSEGDA
jgi:hypothetical protein